MFSSSSVKDIVKLLILKTESAISLNLLVTLSGSLSSVFSILHINLYNPIPPIESSKYPLGDI
ncbi:hypothetical protein D3C73_908020 [compost metagenome]